jgi:hypothetical protein
MKLPNRPIASNSQLQDISWLAFKETVLARYMTSAQVSTPYMPDVGHYPPLKVPDRFAQIVQTYLQAVTPVKPRSRRRRSVEGPACLTPLAAGQLMSAQAYIFRKPAV